MKVAHLIAPVSLLLVLPGKVSAEKKRPNIVFIMTDDHTTQAISAYGSKLVKTPNIDRIANEGMRFDNCYAVNALSGPSRACILTGKFSHKNGFYDKHFFQLHLYKRLVKENYPEIEVSALYNWSPKDWTGETPTYNLKEQTTGSLEKLCDVVFEQGRLKHEDKEPSVTIVPESIMFGVDFQYTKVPLKEYLKTQHGKRDEDKKGSNE